MFSHPQGLRQDGGNPDPSDRWLLFITSFGNPCVQPLIAAVGGGVPLEVEEAAGVTGNGQQTQLGTEAEDTGQGLSGLERGDNDLGGRGQGLKQSFASTAVGNLRLPCGERCGCLWGQAGQRPGPSPLLSGLAVGS